jgi:hypothetical protein
VNSEHEKKCKGKEFTEIADCLHVEEVGKGVPAVRVWRERKVGVDSVGTIFLNKKKKRNVVSKENHPQPQ